MQLFFQNTTFLPKYHFILEKKLLLSKEKNLMCFFLRHWILFWHFFGVRVCVLDHKAPHQSGGHRVALEDGPRWEDPGGRTGQTSEHDPPISRSVVQHAMSGSLKMWCEVVLREPCGHCTYCWCCNFSGKFQEFNLVRQFHPCILLYCNVS